MTCPSCWRLLLVSIVMAAAACGEDGGGGRRPTVRPGAIVGAVTVEGSVRDGVTVRAEGPASATATTGADGTYRLDGLAAGTYSITADLPVHWPATAEGVSVADGVDTAAPTLDLTLLRRVDDGYHAGPVALSSDGHRMLYLAGCRDTSCRLRAWDDATGASRDLGDDVDPYQAVSPADAGFSPDDRWAVYLAITPGSLDFGPVRLVDFETGSLRELGRDGTDFFFSPDSDRLLFFDRYDQETAAGDLRLVDLPAGREATLCTRASTYALALSDDRENLLCLADYDNGAQAGRLERWSLADGAGLVLGAGVPWNVGWSPSMDRVLFVSDFAPGGGGRGRLWRGGAEADVLGEGVQPYRLFHRGDFATGYAVAGDTLVRIDLATGEKATIDRGVDVLAPSWDGDQIYYLKGTDWSLGGIGHLYSWSVGDEAPLDLAADVPFSPLLAAWPHFGVFATDPDPTGSMVTLHRHSFADGSTTVLAQRARHLLHQGAAVAYLHDIDPVANTAGLSILAGDAGEPELLHDGVSAAGACRSFEFSPGLDRALFHSSCDPSTMTADFHIWDRLGGRRDLGPSWPIHVTPDLGRILYFRLGERADGVAELRLFDFAGPTDVSLGTGVQAVSVVYDAALDHVAWLGGCDPAAPPFGCRFDLTVRDVAAGTGYTAMEGLPPMPATEVFLADSWDRLFVVVTTDGNLDLGSLFAYRDGGGPVVTVGTDVHLVGGGLLVDVGRGRALVVSNTDLVTSLGLLRAVDLAGPTVVDLDTDVAMGVRADPALETAVYFKNPHAVGERPAGSLYVSPVTTAAPVRVADEVLPWVIPTEDALLFEVIAGDEPGGFAVRLPE